MKKTVFTVAAAVACVPASALHAQTISPVPAVPAVSGNLLFFPQIEQIPGSHAVSTNFTSIATVNFALPSDLTITAAGRMDWVNMLPGVAKSEYIDVKDLNITYAPSFSSYKITAGTLSYWGPYGSELSFVKWNQVERGFLSLGFGGPNPGLVGVYASGKGDVNGIGYDWRAIAGTGDHYINTSIGGSYFPVLCNNTINVPNSKEACGLVSGGSFTLTPLAGFNINATETFIGNGAGLSNEVRASLGAQYQKEVLGMTMTGLVNANYVTNYLGGNLDMRSLTETYSIKKDFTGTPFALEAYISGTQARDALIANYTIGGVSLTYRYDKKTSLTLSPYIGRESVTGKKYDGLWGALSYDF